MFTKYLAKGTSYSSSQRLTSAAYPRASTTSIASKTAKIAEHWDTLQTIPPRADWKNENGKF
jgi:hypothetical protein